MIINNAITQTRVIASLVPCFFANTLLLLNQFPDVGSERAFGRKNYPIIFGRSYSACLYEGFTLVGFIMILLGVSLGLFPLLSLISLIMLVPALI